MKIQILLNGSWGMMPYPVRAFNYYPQSPADILYVGDGGCRHISKIQIAPKIEWWGDFDSSEDAPLQSAQWEKHMLPKDKDLSDFGAILDRILETVDLGQPLFLEVWGILGGRQDHECINLEELKAFLAKVDSAVAVCHPDIVMIRKATLEVDMPKESGFSIWSHTGQGAVSIRGALYSGNLRLQRPSHGLSNIAEGTVIFSPLDDAIYTLDIPSILPY